MKNKKTINLIAYKDSANIGDNFQTLATKKVLESLGYSIDYVDRDEDDTNEKKVIFINGYYSPKTIKNLNLNFCKNTEAFFYNIHLAGDNGRIKYLKSNFLKNKSIYNSFKRFEPIGCRDQFTADILNSFNIQSENNECITLLMDKRTPEQEKNAKKIILVDVDEFVPMPDNYNKEQVEYRSQMIPKGDSMSNDEKLQLSQETLSYYKENGKLIITSRFHCAMPCIAMGIPVIFFGYKDSLRCKGISKYIKAYDYVHFGFRTRTQQRKLFWSDYIPLLNIKIRYDFNIIDIIYNILFKIYLHILYKFKIRKIDWDFKMPNIENEKRGKIKKIKEKLDKLDDSFFL